MTAVLVTGASGAIGQACVRRFLAAGHRVVAHDLHAPATAEPGVTPISGDLREGPTLDRAAAAAGTAGYAAVVAAHGVAGAAALENCHPGFVRTVLEVDWVTVPQLYEATREGLEHSHGAFVAIASQAGLVGERENSAYCAAKSAVVGWAIGTAERARGHSVHALCPGATESALLRTAVAGFAAALGVSEATYARDRVRSIAVGRFGRPGEIAAAAGYLAATGRDAPVVLAATGGDYLF